MTPVRVKKSALSAGTVAVLLALTAAGCSLGASETHSAETEAAGTSVGDEAAVQAAPERISGDFEISNTTTGGADAVVETLVVSVETAARGSAWTVMPSLCSTTPASPVRIASSTTIAYECLPSSAVPTDARRRVVVHATIAGSDEVFEIVSEIP